jgi:hypothetical protein
MWPPVPEVWPLNRVAGENRMPEGSKDRTPIWVAVITVTGGLLTAIVVNADKLMPGGDTPVVSASPTAASPTPTGSAALAPVTTTGAIPSADPSLAALPAAVTPSASDQATPESAAPIALAGEWRDDEGGRYSFEQTGSNFELTQMSISGNTQMFGRGTISGHDLSYTFEMMTEEKGSCSARVNAAANKITGNCHYPEGGWTFVIER